MNRGAVLVVCYSRLISDPRVMRQIDWLIGDGWTVDTLGFGPIPRPDVRTHFPLRAHRGLKRSPAVRLLLHAVLPHAARFRALDGALVPPDLAADRAGAYDLIVVNDIDLLPWAERDAPALLADGGRVHLDVHEYHRWEAHGRGSTARRILFRSFHRWLVGFIGSPVFSTRTTVAPGIAELYADDFGFDRPAIVRNSPDHVELEPSGVDPEHIALLYHGNPDPTRGLTLLVDALELLPDRFSLTLMLTGTPADRRELVDSTARLGSRVTFVPAVAMPEVARTINRYDLEVIFYPPNSPNHRFSFPNKFFEAIQGRLGIIVGESPSMSEVVREFGNGLVVDGWTAADLARALDSLTPDQIRAFKLGSARAADAISAETEGRMFLESAWPESR